MAKREDVLRVWKTEFNSEGDWSMVEVILDLRAENAKLKEVLQDLYDEQNGPPLLRHKDSWQAAMNKASEALKGE